LVDINETDEDKLANVVSLLEQNSDVIRVRTIKNTETTY
jgi:hypothetical protein